MTDEFCNTLQDAARKERAENDERARVYRGKVVEKFAKLCGWRPDADTITYVGGGFISDDTERWNAPIPGRPGYVLQYRYGVSSTEYGGCYERLTLKRKGFTLCRNVRGADHLERLLCR